MSDFSSIAEPSEYDFIGTLNFQTNQVTRSLVTKGDIYAVIDPITSGFKEFVGTDNVAVEVPIYNGRHDHKNLDDNGFTLVEHVCPNNVDFSDDSVIVRDYYPQVAEFIKDKLGAFKVYCFDHVVRSGSGTMSYAKDGAQKIGGPAALVHGDYALEGAPKRRDNFALPPGNDDSFRPVYGDRPLIPQEELDTLKHRRFAIINLWRSIAPADEPVVDMPLVFCDAQSATENDYGTVEFRYVDKQIETYVGFYSPQQRWYYYPKLHRDEGVLLKTFDSQGAFARDFISAEGEKYAYYHEDKPAVAATSILHSAVKDPRVSADAPTRKSIEVRTMVFY